MKLTHAMLLLGCVSSFAYAALPSSIKICDDGDEWPPFSYYQRDDGTKTKQVVGYSVDYIQSILDKQKVAFSLELLPWKRCLADVKEGARAMLLSASRTPEREKDYLISKPYYAMTGIYFYAKSRPEPKVNNLADLKNFKVCGQTVSVQRPHLAEHSAPRHNARSTTHKGKRPTVPSTREPKPQR